MQKPIPNFHICGRIDLDGTHTAIIETTDPEYTYPGSQTIYVQLHAENQTCACTISEVRLGASEKRIIVDRYKMWHLGLKDGDMVGLEVFSPTPCMRVTYKSPSDISSRDQVRLIGKPITASEKSSLFTFSGEPRPYQVTSTEPEGVVLITPTTELIEDTSDGTSSPISYADIGGLDQEIKLIREIVEYPLKFTDLFSHLGVTSPKGVILHGPPGTGKTLLAKALANEVGANFYSISGPEIYSKWYGNSEQTLRNIFDEAIKNSPSIVVIDELDALVPRRDSSHGDQEQRIVATFLTQMDGMKELKDVVVVGTTNRINEIDPALRRGGRFEQEILIGVSDARGRKKILDIHSRRMPLDDHVDLTRIAEATNGFVGADLASLCREAAYVSLRRSVSPDAFESGKIEAHKDIRVTNEDFLEALKTVPPSAAREYSLDVPPVSWDDIGGMTEAKQLLIENLEYSVKNRHAFDKVGIRPASGILLHGPPGTGKTLLAKAVACECEVNFIAVKGSEIRYKWLGQSEEKIQHLFARARLLAPCVVFFDEIDSVLQLRGRDISGTGDSIVNQILSEMDGIEKLGGVFIMGATNRIDSIDPAALRPGRFDYQLHIPLPDREARESIFQVHLKDKPQVGVNILALAQMTDGFNGAQIAEVCREAAWNALRESGYDADTVTIEMAHLAASIERLSETARKTT